MRNPTPQSIVITTLVGVLFLAAWSLQAQSNRPDIEIEGEITKVTGVMVEINLGKDHGLKVNSTLN